MGSQKQVEASRDGKNRKETVKQTEDDLSKEELKLSGEESSMSQISIETASLVLAMKLLKMVPPDFCIQPPSPHSPTYTISVEQTQFTDALHWDQRQNNWNNRCASCHSSGLIKNYNTKDNSYKTTLREVTENLKTSGRNVQKNVEEKMNGIIVRCKSQ